MYVVANVEPGTFGKMTDEGYPELIPDLKAFENFRYRPVDYRTLVELPESGMPMVGKSETEVDLTKERGEVVIAMKALMARFDFSFKISSANGAVGGLPSLNLTQYEVCNMATAVPSSLRRLRTETCRKATSIRTATEKPTTLRT